jgi:parvulin-like peptidyl-prolyl isomerase
MTNALSSMGYPHWLIIAGVVLLVLGFIGIALRQRAAQAELDEIATGDEEERFEAEAELAQTQAANRKARLEEQKRDRWAKDRSTEEPDKPKVPDKESQ